MATILRLFLLLLSTSYISLDVFAQLAGTPPSCALSCVVPSNYRTHITFRWSAWISYRCFFCIGDSSPEGCASSDTACLCTNPTAVTGVQTCIKQHCTNGTDLSAATAFIQQECNSLTASPSAWAPYLWNLTPMYWHISTPHLLSGY